LDLLDLGSQRGVLLGGLPATQHVLYEVNAFLQLGQFDKLGQVLLGKVNMKCQCFLLFLLLTQDV
jgi:hypothetical protein